MSNSKKNFDPNEAADQAAVKKQMADRAKEMERKNEAYRFLKTYYDLMLLQAGIMEAPDVVQGEAQSGERGIFARLTVGTVTEERRKEEIAVRVQLIKDMEKMTGKSVYDVLAEFAPNLDQVIEDDAPMVDGVRATGEAKEQGGVESTHDKDGDKPAAAAPEAPSA